jgi:uncharacterized protein (TIGR02145 family)
LIGEDTWLARNLNYDPPDAGEGSKCLNGNPENCEKFGRLYNWVTAMDIGSEYLTTKYNAPSKHQGICPVGWYVPTHDEWLVMDINLSRFGVYPSAYMLRAAGEASGWSDWQNGTDKYGFAALPGSGYYSTNGTTPPNRAGNSTEGYDANWWNSTDSYNNAVTTLALARGGQQLINQYEVGKYDFLSLRCLKD